MLAASLIEVESRRETETMNAFALPCSGVERGES